MEDGALLPRMEPGPSVLQADSLMSEPPGKSNCVKVKVKSLSPVQLFATPWTGAYQVPPSMGFSRQECWSGVPFPSPPGKSNCVRVGNS